MRRALLSVLAAPALLLVTACDGDSPAPDPTGTPPGTIGTDVTDDSSAETDAAATTGPEEVEGGADGQAAADVTKAFYLAVVKADPEACDYLFSFTDSTRPMKDVPDDHEMCRQIAPPVLASELDLKGIDEEAVAIFEAMNIRGADVNDAGTLATVDADNVSPWFADALGDNPILLRKVEGEWYVDIDLSFPIDER